MGKLGGRANHARSTRPQRGGYGRSSENVARRAAADDWDGGGLIAEPAVRMLKGGGGGTYVIAGGAGGGHDWDDDCDDDDFCGACTASLAVTVVCLVTFSAVAPASA